MLHSLKNAERAMRLQRASRTPRADGRDERCMGLPTALTAFAFYVPTAPSKTS